MDAKDQQTLLLACLKENCDQARHHEVQRERVTAIVASTTGLIMGLFGFSQSWSHPSGVHLAVPFFMVILGGWGYLAAWKHHERSRMHVQRIRAVRKRLSALSGIDLDDIHAEAYQAHLARFGDSALYESRTHLIWKAFPVIVSLMGLAVGLNILLQMQPAAPAVNVTPAAGVAPRVSASAPASDASK